MEREKDIRNLVEELKIDLESISNKNDIVTLKQKYFGKNSVITQTKSLFRNFNDEEKKLIGNLIKEVSTLLETSINEKSLEIDEKEYNEKLKNEKIDVTLPAYEKVGSLHPITLIIDEVCELFENMGYDLVSGPEVETEFNNFTALNVPENHPARDMQDSFYLDGEKVLRTQTSPVQIRTMMSNKEKGPLRVIAPGRVYRKDEDDATHSHQFTQIEGLLIDENITFSDLKGTIEYAIKELFGESRKVRFRPSYFPFTMPSCEVDISCFKCSGEGCNICKSTGYIEVLGCGMVHPNVLKTCGYDDEKYTAFAFGMGPERLAMLKYGVNDIRDFYNNDIRFLNNFARVKGGSYNEVK